MTPITIPIYMDRLQAICLRLGIHLGQIENADLQIHILQLMPEFTIEITRGYLIVLSGPHRVKLEINPKRNCETCRSLLHLPHQQIWGVTECCNRFYCQFCQDARTLCPICWKSICLFCGKDFSDFHKNIMIHHCKCLKIFRNHLRQGKSIQDLLLLKDTNHE